MHLRTELTNTKRKIAIEKQRQELKNKVLNNPHIKTIKTMNSVIPHIQHNEPEHKHLIFLTTLTPSVEKISSLHGFKIFI